MGCRLRSRCRFAPSTALTGVCVSVSSQTRLLHENGLAASGCEAIVDKERVFDYSVK